MHTASVRSHRLDPGQQTLIEVTFRTAVDGPGRYGESIDVLANDPRLPHRPPLHDLWFLITVR